MADVHDRPGPAAAADAAGRRGRRRDLGGDRLGRGARPGRRPAGRDDQRARAATPWASTSATPTCTRSASRPTACRSSRPCGPATGSAPRSVDQLPHQFVAWQLYGHQLLLPIPDIDRTSYFLVFGANPMASNGSLMTVPDFPQRLRDLKARGGQLVVFDPRRTETAKVATEHHFVRPGTDAAVLLAMLHVLFEEGLTTRPGVRRRASTGSPSWSPTSPPSAPRRPSGVPAERSGGSPASFAAADGRGGVRPDGGVDAGVRLGVPVGDQPAEPAHRQLRPRGRRAVPGAGHRHRRPAASSVRATTTSGAAGCATCRSSAASCRPRRCARRSRRPATARSGRW